MTTVSNVTRKMIGSGGIHELFLFAFFIFYFVVRICGICRNNKRERERPPERRRREKYASPFEVV